MMRNFCVYLGLLWLISICHAQDIKGLVQNVNDSLPAQAALSPLNCRCKYNEGNRIVGGSATTAHKVPWQISLAKWNQHICGGTILNQRWVLTAAHCVYQTQVNSLTVRVGLHYLSDPNIAHYTYAIRRILVHGQYSVPGRPTAGPGDMALIELTRPITFNDNVQPACLPSQFEHYDDMQGSLLATGWGSIRSTILLPSGQLGNAVTSNVLKEAHFTYASPASDRLGQLLGLAPSQLPPDCVKSYLICIKPLRQGDSVCNGDSGGPIHHIRNGRVRMVGVASYVLGGRNAQNQVTYCLGDGAYARVTSYLSFIRSYIGNNYCSI